MSTDPLARISSPSSSLSSPSRSSSVLISRPSWPGSLSSPSSSLRHSFTGGGRTSQPSSTVASSSNWISRGMSPGPQQQWQQQITPRQNTGSTLSLTPFTQDETTKQWSFIGFEWVVRNVHKLRDFVEQVPHDSSEDGTVTEGESSAAEPLEADDFEILKQSPILGDHKFKLEISRTTNHGHDHETSSPQSLPSSLCLYITCLTLDMMPHLELPAAMMTAVKCQDDRMAMRTSPPDWVWENWQHDFVFRQDSEVFACPLPPLSDLLQNSRIRDTDSMVICLQIHCPGPVANYPTHPSVHYVPRDLLDGLEASLDNPNTGDVRFVCLERLQAEEVTSPGLPASETSASPTTLRSPSSTSTVSHSSPFSAYTTARKRIIYAHSDILIRRSEYFATMLASSFAETNPQGVAPGERKLYTVVVEEADFETIYWLLKFCYANWLLFKENDEPRAAVDGIGAGWSAKWLTQNQGRGEWDWKTFTKSGVQDGDTRSATSGESLTTAESARSPVVAAKGGNGGNKSLQPPPSSNTTSPPRTSNTSTARTTTGSTTATKSSSARPSITPTTPRRPSNHAGTTTTGSMALSMSSSSRSKPVPVPLSLYPISSNSQRRKSNILFSTPDPHIHPTPPPPPASALSMYYLAHRYDMPGLSNLALEHMMSTLTAESSFALLLASHAWEELRGLVEDYIVEKWDEVSVTAEFERCCQEVAAGEWGSEGGTTMMALFRRLRSPNAIFSRV